MEAQWQDALAYLVVLVGVGKVFSETLGGILEGLNEAVIRAAKIPSDYKPALNYGMSILLVALATVVLAANAGAWYLIPGGVLVGLFVARAADAEHQVKKALTESTTSPESTTSVSRGI